MSNFFYNQYNSVQAMAIEEQEKSKQFLERIEPFSTVETLDEARELAEKILPSKEGLTSFFVGNIKCTIVNKKDMLRISVDSPEMFTCYDFS